MGRISGYAPPQQDRLLASHFQYKRKQDRPAARGASRKGEGQGPGASALQEPWGLLPGRCGGDFWVGGPEPAREFAAGRGSCTLYKFGLEAGLCLPMYKEPVYIHSPQKADVLLQCLTTPIMGGNGLSRSGGKLGFRA